MLTAYGLRKSQDIDCISVEGVNISDEGNVSSHESEKKYYPDSFNNLVFRHSNYFIINGVKFLSADNMIKFKLKRHELFKDFRDLYYLVFLRGFRKTIYFFSSYLWFIPMSIVKRLLKKLSKR